MEERLSDNPLFSIIIPTKNEERNIARCLKAITDSSYKNIEVIIVDQTSSDRTPQIAKELGATVIQLPPTDKYVPPSNSRNVGFEKSSGEIIYHMDADMEVTPELIEECVTIFKNNVEVVAVVVPEKDVPLNFWARGKAFERSMYLGTQMEAARVSLRSVFKNVKYSRDIFSGEDWNIDKLFRENGEISRTENVVNHHIGKISISKEFKKKMHYGTGSTKYVQENKESIMKKLIMLLKVYTIGTLKGIFIAPKDCLSFLIIRTVDIVALTIGYINRNKSTK